jgi:SAM-dependent methyltransferase
MLGSILMRYRIAGGIEIRTENAAKPESQPSKYLLELLKQLPRVGSVFDYGCGKLRYQAAIMEHAETLTLVDSEVQVSRRQTLRGREISIRDIFESSNRIQVCNDVEFWNFAGHFDRGFCINVLSVIPSYSRRTRVLETIRRKLRGGGECLFVVQYRNSDFTRMKNMANAKAFLDGFIVDSRRGHSFYGMISPERLASMLRKVGFVIRVTKLNEGSVYCWAART